MNKTTYRFHLGLQGHGLFPRFHRGIPSPPFLSLSLSASKGSCAIIHLADATPAFHGSPIHQARSYGASCIQRTPFPDFFHIHDQHVSSKSSFTSTLPPVTSNFPFFKSVHAIF
jgi:hypothetical protein